MLHIKKASQLALRGFVELSLQLSNKILDDLTKFYENIVGLENKTDFTVLNTV
jgi:hypothetical protein